MFFSVKSAVKIAGKTYTPCVCYPVSEFLKPTIDKMVKEGKAYAYEHKVAFQNGKVLVKKEVEEAKPDNTKKSKKAKKEDIKEEDEIPSPEEIADNVEDF